MIYVDMDGSLARFYENAGCLEAYTEPGFFANLKPYENMVAAVDMLSSIAYTSVLSTVPNLTAADKKKDWLKQNMTGVREGRIKTFFNRADSTKEEYVRFLQSGRPLKRTDILLDDFSRNCVGWENAGGTAVKLLNELNGRGWNDTHWTGRTVDICLSAEEIFDSLMDIICNVAKENLLRGDIPGVSAQNIPPVQSVTVPAPVPSDSAALMPE